MIFSKLCLQSSRGEYTWPVGRLGRLTFLAKPEELEMCGIPACAHLCCSVFLPPSDWPTAYSNQRPLIVCVQVRGQTHPPTPPASSVTRPRHLRFEPNTVSLSSRVEFLLLGLIKDTPRTPRFNIWRRDLTCASYFVQRSSLWTPFDLLSLRPTRRRTTGNSSSGKWRTS